MGRAVLLCFLVALVSADPTVDGPLGKISGKVDTVLGVEIEAFLGIPYAKPPKGNLRFALPEPYGAVGNLQATKYGPDCPQHVVSSLSLLSEVVLGEEDCLFLNVFRKRSTTKDEKKAVVAIVHGGGYTVGSGANVHQSAEPLAGFGDVIIVSFNYRLGIFGFADMGELAPGNLGLRDQRLALQWIQDNIADFGGDPQNVTIMGVSAGAMSVAAQIITIIDKKDYFRAAVLDAGVVASHGFLEDPESSLVRIKKIANEVGCPTDSNEMLECLRKVPFGTLLANSTSHPGSSGIKSFIPTTDGVFLPRDVEEYVEKGSPELRKIPTIVGYSLDEGTMFVNLADQKFNFSTSKTKDEILDYCGKTSALYDFPVDVSKEDIRNKVAQFYIDDNSGSAFKAVSSFIADGFFKCRINSFIRSYSKHNDKVFAYQFERLLGRKYFSFFDPKTLGAFHFSPYLHFGGALLLDEGTVNEADKQFALDAMEMISKFSKSDGNPEFRGTEWPSFSKAGEILILNEQPTLAKELGSERNCRELFS